MVFHEPVLNNMSFLIQKVIRDLDEFKEQADVIVSNRICEDLGDVKDMVYTRDLLNVD